MGGAHPSTRHSLGERRPGKPEGEPRGRDPLGREGPPDRYLAEFQDRFNRRFDLKSMLPRLLTVAVRTPAMPQPLLKLAWMVQAA